MTLTVLLVQKTGGGHAFQAGDRRGWIEFVRAIGRATLLRMAQVTAGIAGYRLQTFLVSAIARVILQAPGPVQRGRAEIIPVPGNDVTGGVTDATVDTFDGRVSGLPLGGAWRNIGDLVIARAGAGEMTFSPFPFFEKLAHIAGEVPDYRKVAQRLDGDAAVLYNLVDMGATGPARNSVDHHRAGTTHTHAAGKAIAQAGIEVTLDPGDHVENGLTWLLRDFESLQFTAPGVAAPHADSNRL